MDRRVPKPELAVEKRLEQKHAQSWRSDYGYGTSGQERSSGHVHAENRFCRRARDSRYGLAPGFCQMKIQNIASIAVFTFFGFASSVAAQTSKPTTAPSADLSGVWYPSSGSTLGGATPDNPGQQFV